MLKVLAALALGLSIAGCALAGPPILISSRSIRPAISALVKARAVSSPARAGRIADFATDR
jgi:hypothetical protein